MAHTNKLSDADLVRRSLENVEDFGLLVERYEQKLLYYILRISSVDMLEAEEMLQEVFLKVWKNLNGYDSGLSFQSWIYRITHNHVISHHRKHKNRQTDASVWDEDVIEKLPSSLDTEHKVDQNFEKEKVKEALEQLPEKYREILVLRFFQDLSYEEISDVLKKPSGTVATLINRAKKQFEMYYLKNSL